MADHDHIEEAENGGRPTLEERRVEELLARAPRRSCPPRVRETVMARLREEAASSDARASTSRRSGPRVIALWFRRHTMALAQAAALLAIAVITLTVYIEFRPQLGFSPKPPQRPDRERGLEAPKAASAKGGANGIVQDFDGEATRDFLAVPGDARGRTDSAAERRGASARGGRVEKAADQSKAAASPPPPASGRYLNEGAASDQKAIAGVEPASDQPAAGFGATQMGKADKATAEGDRPAVSPKGGVAPGIAGAPGVAITQRQDEVAHKSLMKPQPSPTPSTQAKAGLPQAVAESVEPAPAVQARAAQPAAQPQAVPAQSQPVQAQVRLNLQWFEIAPEERLRRERYAVNAIDEIQALPPTMSPAPADRASTWSASAQTAAASFGELLNEYGGYVLSTQSVVLEPGKRRALVVECEVPDSNTGALIETVNQKRVVALESTLSPESLGDSMVRLQTPATPPDVGQAAVQNQAGRPLQRIRESDVARNRANAVSRFYVQTPPPAQQLNYQNQLGNQAQFGYSQNSLPYLRQTVQAPSSPTLTVYGALGASAIAQQNYSMTGQVRAQTNLYNQPQMRNTARNVQEQRFLNQNATSTSLNTRLYFVLEPEPLNAGPPPPRAIQSLRK
jgi:hypothetical protein